MMWYLIFGFLFLLSPSVSAVQLLSEVELKLKKDSSSETIAMKAGDVLDIKRGETLYAMPAEGLPFFILVPSSDDSKISLAGGDVQSMAQSQIAKNIGTGVNEVVHGLRKAEVLMSKKEFTQAIQILAPIKVKHPLVADVYFLSGSLNFLIKNKGAAIEDLQKGLAIRPDDSAAKKLLDEIQKGVQ